MDIRYVPMLHPLTLDVSLAPALGDDGQPLANLPWQCY